MNKQKLAVIYARVSSQKQKDGETIESQVSALKVLAKKQSYQINDNMVFLDNGISGKFLQRPALDELRDIIRCEPISALFVYSPDRLSRNYTHQLILLEEFHRHGIQVIYVKGPSETESPEAKMLTHMQGIFAEYERALILDRSRRGRYHKAKMNDASILPRMPYGYQRTRTNSKTEVSIKKPESDVVKEIFSLYVHAGFSMNKIAEKLTKDGILTPKGNTRWCPSAVSGILKNQSYIGTSYYGKTEHYEGISNKIRNYPSGRFKKPKYARRLKPEEDWIAIDMPQIISENDFEITQTKLKANSLHASRNTEIPGLLQGLIICGECGKPYYKRSRKYPRRIVQMYYCSGGKLKDGIRQCSNSWINLAELDRLVFEEVMRLLKTPDFIQKELERRIKEKSSYEELSKREILNKKEHKSLQEIRDRLLDAYQAGAVSLEELISRNNVMDNLKRELQEEQQAIQAEKMITMDHQTFYEDCKSILNKLESSSGDLSFEDRQRVVRLLVQQVVIKRDEILVTHCIAPKEIAHESGQLHSDGCG